MKIEHVAIWATDIETLKGFYETYFGATPNRKYVNREKQFSSYVLTFSAGARLEIMQMQSVDSRRDTPYQQCIGLAHLAIALGSREGVDTLTARLAADGYEVIDGPRTTGDGYYESVVLDPENNRIEITV